MLDLNRDHISLILPSGSDYGSGKKSLRRSWNQLSRFQRNLIITVIIGVCLTCLLLLPGDDVINSGANQQQEVSHIKIAPFKDQHENLHDKHKNQPTDESTEAVAKHANQIDENIAADDTKTDEGNPNGNGNEIKDENENVVDEPNINNERHRNNAIENVESLEDNEPKIFKGPTNERQKAVVDAFRHAWRGYKEFAWGHDNLKPLTAGYSDWFGLGLTIVDALDTIYIMNLNEEYEEARNWVEKDLVFNVNRDVNLFEVTIRVLGGLLSVFHLTGDKMYLAKATDLGSRLLPCFDSQSGIPYSDVNLATLKAHSPKWSPDSSTSEVTTIQLEFRDLSRSTGDTTYETVSAKVNEKVHELEKNEGLVPIFINANTGMFRSFSTISLGARADSYYEYLLKQWLQTGKKVDDFLIEDYQIAVMGVLNQLVRQTPNEQHVYIGELINGKEFKPKMDHLTCYFPGTLLLGYKNGMPDSHLQLAKDLLETCYQTYMKQPTLLAPEITYFNLHGESDTDIYVKTNDAHNLLRPEFIESLYYFYVITGNRTYQDMGWTIFKAFEKHTRVKNGYTSIGNVRNVLNTRPRDMMESFFLGETLKYFYLLFSDDRNEIDIDKYVFNTEAHPLPILKN